MRAAAAVPARPEMHVRLQPLMHVIAGCTHTVAGSGTYGCNRAGSAFISAASDGAEGAAAPRSSTAVAGFLAHEAVGNSGAGMISLTGSTQWNLR
jgi:hypothetical protein